MKNLKICFLIISLVGLISCNKDYAGDSYDFSSSTNPYVQLKVTKITATTTIPVTVRVRTAISSAATVVNYQLAGAMTSTGSITIDRNKTEGTVNIAVPTGTVTAGSTATITLTGAINSQVTFDLGWNGAGKSGTITFE